MKINKLYAITFACLIISIILSAVIRNYKMEEGIVGGVFGAVIVFPITPILISASLTSFMKNVIKDKFYSILLILLFGAVSCIFYFIIFLFAFANIGGEGGVIFGAIFGVLGSIFIGLLAIIINFLILTRKVDKKSI